jgi:glycosyl transferase family 87
MGARRGQQRLPGRGGALLHGHSPYDASDLGYLHLSFTYPPAAALLFTPLAALPAQLAWAVMASASVLALALVIRVAIAAVPYWRFPAACSTPLLTAAMLCLVPVWRTIGLGQVNVVLVAMVAVDVLAVPDWRAGPASGAVMAVIAVFACTYSVPISEQRNRTLSSFWFFVLSNPYVLTAITLARALGAAGALPPKREKFLLSEFPLARVFELDGEKICTAIVASPQVTRRKSTTRARRNCGRHR